MVGSKDQECRESWEALPLWQFASGIRPASPAGQSRHSRTPESERARLAAYRKTDRGAEYYKGRNKINAARDSEARKCIREGAPIPAHLPQWCRELARPDKVAKARAHTDRHNQQLKAAIKNYRETGSYGDDTPAYAVNAARKYIEKCAKGAERDAGRDIASWFFRQVMGRAHKAQKAARNRIKNYALRADKGLRRSATNALGCSKAEFKRHIESMFEPWMTWESYGTEWHIDHVVPLSFAGDDIDAIEMLGNYRNTQPLRAFENISKHDSMPEKMTEWQADAVKIILARRASNEPEG